MNTIEKKRMEQQNADLLSEIDSEIANDHKPEPVKVKQAEPTVQRREPTVQRQEPREISYEAPRDISSKWIWALAVVPIVAGFIISLIVPFI